MGQQEYWVGIESIVFCKTVRAVGYKNADMCSKFAITNGCLLIWAHAENLILEFLLKYNDRQKFPSQRKERLSEALRNMSDNVSV